MPGGHADAHVERAQAGAGAEMRDDHAALRKPGRFARELPGDPFEGQAVEAIAPDPGFRDRPRQRELLRNPRHRVMKSGVEAGDLRDARAGLPHRADRREIVRQMDRIERDHGFERREQRGVQPLGYDVICAAVDDAVADRAQPVMPRRRIDDRQQRGKSPVVAAWPVLIGDRVLPPLPRARRGGERSPVRIFRRAELPTVMAQPQTARTSGWRSRH